MSEMSEFLDVRVGDVKMPQNLPSGTYRFVLTRYSLERSEGPNKTPYVRATFKPVEAIDTAGADVDIDNSKNIQVDFWRTEKADKIAVRFLTQTLRLPATEDSLLSELWEQSIGSEMVGVVKSETKTSKNGNPYTETTIERFFPADHQAAA